MSQSIYTNTGKNFFLDEGQKFMAKLIVVSNRLPISISKQQEKIQTTRSTGGLATGMSAISKERELRWVGWPGIPNEELEKQDIAEITEELTAYKFHPVFLDQKQIKLYYEGFSNKTIWPLFHYFPLNTIYEESFWDVYKEVNEIFSREVLKIAKPGDYIWVNDYQLMLLPELLRKNRKNLKIGFFLHIPFPSFELFRLLPWRREILEGMLGSDVLGFHTYDYVRHFLSSVCRLRGLEHNLGKLSVNDRIVKVDAFPMGIDYEKYSKAPDKPEVKKEIEKIRKKVGDCKIVISIDRLDYTKGIIERLEAFDWFLSNNPEYKGKVTLIMVAVPSRTNVDEYQNLREHLEKLIGRVNGEHGTIGWMPVWYLYRAVPFDRLMALYKMADLALVTPLRDGMNLIAKEFVAAKDNKKGILVLSEMAGAASELGEAIIVNANNKSAIVEAIKEGLKTPEQQQVQRNRSMQKRLKRYTVQRWADDFIRAFEELEKSKSQLHARKLVNNSRKKLFKDYKKAHSRLILLDYDGTLADFKKNPSKAGPQKQLLEILKKLCDDSKNEVIIISGRDKNTLTEWLGNLNLSLVSEHGSFIRQKNGKWKCIEHMHNDWKNTILPILELYADRTPGAMVEEKEFSLVWHCRRSAPELAYIRTQELRDALVNLTVNLDVGVFEGNKILEIRNLGVNKGKAAEIWLDRKKWDFVLTAGDDYTDEEMFAVMPEYAYSIKVGTGVSKAKYTVESVQKIHKLLTELTGE